MGILDPRSSWQVASDCSWSATCRQWAEECDGHAGRGCVTPGTASAPTVLHRPPPPKLPAHQSKHHVAALPPSASWPLSTRYVFVSRMKK